jgi:hypothetical protein
MISLDGFRILKLKLFTLQLKTLEHTEVSALSTGPISKRKSTNRKQNQNITKRQVCFVIKDINLLLRLQLGRRECDYTFTRSSLVVINNSIRKLSAHERFGINREHPILSRYFVFNDRSGWNFN